MNSLLQSLSGLFRRPPPKLPKFSQYYPKKLDVNVWNNLLEVESGKWNVNFFFNHPKFLQTEEAKYVIYSTSTFGFAMVEANNKFVKGTKRHIYSLGFHEAIRMCFLDSEQNESVEFNRPIFTAEGSLHPSLRHQVRVKATPQQTIFTMFDFDSAQGEPLNPRTFSMSSFEFTFLCEVIKQGTSELTGHDAQFLMIYNKELNQAARDSYNLQDQASHLKSEKSSLFIV